MDNQCISIASYKVLVNETISEVIYSKCGLRQGDPLSPYLFIFCMDIFSRMLLFGENLKLFKGISVAKRGPKISHLFLADDALLFFNASHQACENSNSLTARFCYISSQQINFQKPLIKFSPYTPIFC